MPPIFTYLEDVDNVSPQNGRFSYKDGSATSRYQLSYKNGDKVISANDLANAVTDVLGDVAVSGLGLKRKLPLAHPLYQWMYASEITEIRGVGPRRRVPIANQAALVAPSISNFWESYQTFYFTINFTPRPYAVLPDSYVSTTESMWYPASTYDPTQMTGVMGNNPIPFEYMNEWVRYVDWQPTPLANSVTGNQGQMYFADSNILINGAPPVFPGMPRMPLNEQQISMTWYNVPFDPYVSNPNGFLNLFRGHINQFDWFLWDKGTLLYLNFSIVRFTPPVQAIVVTGDPFAKENPGIKVTFSTQKYCDIKLEFLQCQRPKNPASTYQPLNNNWLPVGWNLLPYAGDRTYFYYSTIRPPNVQIGPFNINGANNQNFWQPSWNSVPFELLFCSPNGAQPAVQVL